ncbi:nuclear transport factor 2 family protein [Alteromonas oceanisediminis]|uniref:nuclear transport factor 2 family protein n=1 Tax=Alteromonas oceanisediminis TaxID=2836180 RepID=UPI001BDAA2D5|nr:nuclear transport factor 2 family protein [Alteromonas oceanisediminis]MBT0585602.1 nuclear transport factor 2 family protein [Alteromonas oceanisediminis]
MSNLLTKVALSFVVLFTLSHQVSAHDHSTPEDAINVYITAVSTGSGEHIVKAFSESASIQYYDDENTFKRYTRHAFSTLVDTGNTWDAKINIVELRKTGNAASATVEFTWGADEQHGYVDYLNLIYDGSRWQITDKVANYVKRK